MLDPDEGKAISTRAFLVGCPRSGTTLLQSMLMGHPRIASYPETHFFVRGFGGRRRWVLHETLRGWYLWYLLVHWLVVHEEMPLSRAHHVPVSWSKERMVDVFRGVLDRRTAARDKDIWIEKTPRHLHFIDVIGEHVPAPVFIHIIRDGRAVVASMHQLAQTNPETWSPYRSVDTAIRRWNRSVRDTLRYASDDAHVVVEYDRLVKTPETPLRRVATVLGVDYDPKMASHFHEAADRVVKPHESWKERAMTGELQHRGLEKFYTVFSEREQDHVESNLDWSSYRALGGTPL